MITTASAIPPYRGAYRSRMEEWSYIRPSNQQTNPSKFFANKLEDAHAEFLDNNLHIDEYLMQIFSFLEHESEHSEVLAFFTTVQDRIENQKFCPNQSVKFSTLLLREFKRYQLDNSTTKTQAFKEPFEEESESQDDLSSAVVADPVRFDPDDPERLKKKKRTRINIENVFRNKHRGELESDAFWTAVSDFAMSKIWGRLHNRPEQSITADDHAQEIVLKVLEKLPTFSGRPESFYPWLNRICWTTGCDALTNSKDEQDSRVSLFIEHETGDIEENPELYLRDVRPEYARELPDFIQGTDLLICQYIRNGDGYKEISRVLHISQKAIECRVAAMKARNIALGFSKNHKT